MSRYLCVWTTGYGIVYLTLSRLLCAAFITARLCWETISAPCFLLCYLLVVPLAIYHTLTRSLIKTPTSPSVSARYEVQEMEKMSEILTATVCTSCHSPWIHGAGEETFLLSRNDGAPPFPFRCCESVSRRPSSTTQGQKCSSCFHERSMKTDPCL